MVVVGDVVTSLRRYDKMHIFKQTTSPVFSLNRGSIQVERKRTLKCLVEDIMTLGDFELWNQYICTRERMTSPGSNLRSL